MVSVKMSYCSETHTKNVRTEHRAFTFEACDSRPYEEGEGKQVYAGGDWYEGRWRAGLPDGRGKLWYMGGGFFEGMWMGGKPSGPGVLDLQEAGGERVDGRWSEGHLEDEWGKV